MNFEKWMKKRGNSKLNAYAKNPYHVSWIKRMPTWSKIVVPAALAMTAAVVVISVGVLPHLGANKAASGMKQSNAEFSSAPMQTSQDNQKPGSQAQSTMNPGEASNQTISSFTYENNRYDRSSKTLNITEALATYINQKLGTISLINTNQQIVEVDLYSFKNIGEEVAIAINDHTGDAFTIYFNNSCHFHDIDDFVDLLSPASEIKINNISYFDTALNASVSQKYANYVDTAIYDILFEDGSIEGYTAIDYDYESSYKYFYTELKIPALGDYSFTAYFYDSGYIVFNLLSQNHIFELGQERYQAFATYLENYKISH